MAAKGNQIKTEKTGPKEVDIIINPNVFAVAFAAFGKSEAGQKLRAQYDDDFTDLKPPSKHSGAASKQPHTWEDMLSLLRKSRTGHIRLNPAELKHAHTIFENIDTTLKPQSGVRQDIHHLKALSDLKTTFADALARLKRSGKKVQSTRRDSSASA